MSVSVRNGGTVRRRRRAFTLIELLIVVAIIAIMSAATFSIITAPLQEDVLSDIEASAETGLATFFSALVQDAHSATVMEPQASGDGMRLRGAAAGGADVVYQVDAQRRLRRMVTAEEGPDGPVAGPAPGAAILENVEALTVEAIPDSRLWRVAVRGGTTRFGRPLIFDRQVNLGVGVTSFSGGGL